MSIVKKLVNLLDGNIDIESKVGIGTKVTITLPLKLQSIKDIATKSEEKIEIINLAGKRILVVEDNMMNREIAQEILNDEGVIVEIAEDGDIAVEIVKNASPDYFDAILMDIQMPRMNGYTATKLIRDIPSVNGERIPIIALSANAFEEDKKKSLDAGMDDHLAKPIVVSDLLRSLSFVIKPNLETSEISFA